MDKTLCEEIIMIKSYNMADKVRQKFYPVQQMAGFDPTQIATLGAGVAIYQEIQADSELAGLAIAAEGDEVYDLKKVPWDMDRDKPVQARLHFFSSTGTATDVIDWVATLKGLAIGEAASDAKATPDALFTFPAKALNGVADGLNVTDWIKVDAPIFAAADLFMQMSIECNGLGTAGANEIVLSGIELAYTINRSTMNNEKEYTDTQLANDRV